MLNEADICESIAIDGIVVFDEVVDTMDAYASDCALDWNEFIREIEIIIDFLEERFNFLSKGTLLNSFIKFG